MSIEIEATYEDGMLKPDHPLPLEEHQRVKLVVEQDVSHARASFGIIGWKGEPEILRKIAIEPEFGIHESPWRLPTFTIGFIAGSPMDIYNLLTDEPIEKALREAAASEPDWRPYVDRLIEIVQFLKSIEPAVRIYAVLNELPPRLFLSGTNECSMELWVDRFDGPRSSGLGSHVRMQIRRNASVLTEDVRSQDLHEVSRQICEKFGLRTWQQLGRDHACEIGWWRRPFVERSGNASWETTLSCSRVAQM
jgi:predicted DNA-binding antitoxin AbrB/MazE fold protein